MTTATTARRPAVRVEVILLPYSTGWLRNRLRVLTADGSIVCRGWFDGRTEAREAGEGWARANGYPMIGEG